MYINHFEFEKAVPVWKQEDTKVMNQTLDLIAQVTAGCGCLRIAGSTLYEVFVNGAFCAFGPARAAHGYYRCDELALDQWLTKENNEVLIRVCGYNVNAYSYLDQPSFVCAEIVRSGEVLAYTGAEDRGFAAYLYTDRIQKIQRYSFQRTFCEAYRMGQEIGREPVALELAEPKQFICRDVPYGEYRRILPKRVFARGKVTYSDKDEYYSRRYLEGRCEADIDGIRRKGYPAKDIEYASCFEYEKIDFGVSVKVDECAGLIRMEKDSYADVAFAENRAGLIQLEVIAEGDGTLFVGFDERYLNEMLEPLRPGMCSIVTLEMKAGSHRMITIQPYVFQYLRLVAKGCDMTVSGLQQISVAYPESRIKARFVSDDVSMKRIYEAALNTFCDNTVDIYMDCPSRERAGWLCDSFFTARVERILTGESSVEKAFLYNFLYQEQDTHLPEGMLPMCYPGDHYDGNYIPNWAMWYVIELKEYFERTGDEKMVEDARVKLYRLLEYFKAYENEGGLLEKLGGWIFVDWSEANQLVQDVSYPSNMMYAYCLEAMAELYQDPDLRTKADRIREVIRKQAMTDSGFFCDNAVRNENGVLELSGKCTEACQYYAFFTGTAMPETYPELFRILVEEFGFDRQEKGLYPEIYPANAFIANYIRLEILCRYGKFDALYGNIKGYFTYMAQRTGTLWEMVSDTASMNHGFASHVIYWMEKLGLVE